MVLLPSGPVSPRRDPVSDLSTRLRGVSLNDAAPSVPLPATAMGLALAVRFILQTVGFIVGFPNSRFGVDANFAPLQFGLLAVFAPVALLFAVGLAGETRSSDTERFQRVKLVEFPREGSYAPAPVGEATGGDRAAGAGGPDGDSAGGDT